MCHANLSDPKNRPLWGLGDTKAADHIRTPSEKGSNVAQSGCAALCGRLAGLLVRSGELPPVPNLWPVVACRKESFLFRWLDLGEGVSQPSLRGGENVLSPSQHLGIFGSLQQPALWSSLSGPSGARGRGYNRACGDHRLACPVLEDSPRGSR